LITRRTFVVASLAASASCGRRRAAGFNGYAFVANREGRAIAAVDLSAFVVARHIHLEARPTAILSHPDLPFAYALTPENGTVHEIATSSLAVRRKARVAHSAVTLRLAPDGRSIWVLCDDPHQLVELPIQRFRPGARIRLEPGPADFDLMPPSLWTSGRRLAAVSLGKRGRIAVVDLTAGTSRAIDLGKELSLARFRSDGRQVLIGNTEERRLVILDVATGRLIVNLPVAVAPEKFCVKADGGQVFLSGEGMDAIAVVYPYSTEVAETVLAGSSPGAMAEVRTAEDASYLMVANSDSGEVTILDMEERRVIAVVGVGQGPAFITCTPDREYALVLNRVSGDMAVIRLAAITASRARSAPLFTIIPVGSEPVSAAVMAV
jgi:YVTN family beta-propeller protein